MASNPIETAPRNEELTILVDEKTGSYEVARWSTATNDWVREEGGPVRITPTHWMEPNASWASSANRLRIDPTRRHRRTRHVLYAGAAAVSIVLFASFVGNIGSPPPVRTKETLAKTSPVAPGEPASQTAPNSAAVMAKGAATGEGPPQNRQQIIERGPQPTTVAAARADIEIPVAQTAQPPATNALEQGRKAQADPTDHKDAFEKERQRSDALSLELALARQEIEARRAAADAADVAAKMAQAAVSNNREAVEKERRRGDDLDRDLATAREEVEALQARVAAALAARHDAEHAMQTAQASAAEQKHAHERERERAAALARELASGREKVEALQARLAGALARVETARAAQAAGAPAEAAGYVAAASTEAIGSPEMRVDNKLVADQQPVAAPRASVGRDDSVAGPADEPQAATLAGLAKPAARPPRAAEEIALWLKRGEDFVAVGDFASARLLFRRAAESGDADAALMLAATYDPSVFDRFQVKGLAANLAEAQSWYQKAKDLGSAEAPRRLELLVQMRR